MRYRPSILLVCIAMLAATPLHGQRMLERTPNLPNSVNALPGVLETSLPHRFIDHGDPVGLNTSTTFDVALGMPFPSPLHWTAGVRFAHASETVPGESDEWEAYDRLGVLRQAEGAPVDLNITGAYNFTSNSLDGEAAVARQAGPLRLIGAARAMSSPYGADDARYSVTAGAVWHVRPGRLPVTLAADVGSLVDRADGEKIAWSAGAQIGLPYTPFAFSLQASNAATTTLEGASVARGGTRWGFELNVPVEFAGFVLGWYTERERALESVEEDVDAPATHVVPVRRYAYAPAILRVRAGDVVEWVNEDEAVHTVTAENGSFDSGGLERGETWRARFDEPGRYPYYCLPHPFMKAIVVVTPR